MTTAQRVYVFDAYGTLLDVHSAVAQHSAAMGADGQRFSDVWRNKQLEYTWTYSLMRRYVPFWQLTENALEFAFKKFPHIDRALRQPLLDAYRTLSAYADAADTLQRLREQGIALAVLSNGNREMLAQAFAASKLDALLDRIISVDEVGVFKTDPRVYQLVIDSFHVARSDVTFVSSNRWDVAGAASFGFDAIWVNRTDQPNEYLDCAPRRVIQSLREL
jgi:2-haloacid dehalogenase